MTRQDRDKSVDDAFGSFSEMMRQLEDWRTQAVQDQLQQVAPLHPTNPLYKDANEICRQLFEISIRDKYDYPRLAKVAEDLALTLGSMIGELEP